MLKGSLHIPKGIRFREAFENKGRHAALLQEIPVYVVANELLPLYGAAKLAQGLLK